MTFDPDQGKTGFARDLWRLRRDLRGPGWRMLTQSQFAARFGLSVGAVKDAEQGRYQPSAAMRVLVAAIELDPALIERAVGLSNKRRRRNDAERIARNNP